MTQKSDSILRIVTVGHVDHGKSTLVGRLLHETGSLPTGRYDTVKALCEAESKPFEFAFLLDALEEERAQGITIDTAQVWMNTGKRPVTILDAPGHKEFVRNMVCGAAGADAALIMIDAQEGVREQSRRHAQLIEFLGLRQVLVLVNKMDLVGWSRERYESIRAEYEGVLTRVGLEARHFAPLSAREGDNVTAPSEHMSWYGGPTVLELIDSLEVAVVREDQPLRFSIQDVYKFDERRILAGRVESGVIAAGDEVLFSPSNKRATVRSIERWSAQDRPESAEAGESIGITLENQVFIERGEVCSHPTEQPVVTDVFRAKIFWMGPGPLKVGSSYELRLLTSSVGCVIDEFIRVIDAGSINTIEDAGAELAELDCAEVVVRTELPIAVDAYHAVPEVGRFVLVDGMRICGGGTVSNLQFPDQRAALHPEIRSTNITWNDGAVASEDRAAVAGHAGAVVWLTGLSGSGKSTLSRILERTLHERGVRTYRLDGDNVRHGLNSDLGFSPDERAENIRRVAEVAALFADAGMVVITSFISPYRSDRRRAREIVARDRFLEVFVDCSLEECERRERPLRPSTGGGNSVVHRNLGALRETSVRRHLRQHRERGA